jgi:hypothetical protein
MHIVKQRPFVLVLRIVDATTKEPLVNRRVAIDFNIQAAMVATGNLPNLLQYKDEDDYTKQITDGKGDLACSFVINDVSRKYDPQGFVLTAKVDGTEETVKSLPFKVISKRKPESPSSTDEKPARKMQRLMDKIEELEKRVLDLESKAQ